jgi:hypothetical protein
MATDAPEVAGPQPTPWDRAPAPVTRVTRAPRQTIDRRRLLWRDSATILIAVTVALLAFQAFGPANGILPAGSATPEPSGVAIGSFQPPATLAPGETFGPIIDPSLGIDATPTPIPVITMGPSPSPSPSPSLSPSPPMSPKPSTRPTPKPSTHPSSAPTPTPPPAPTDTPPPTPAPPVAAFDCTPSTGLVLSCSDSSSNADTWLWDWGDGTTDSGQNPPAHRYQVTDPNPATVTLTVSGPGPGSDFVTHQYLLVP